MIRILTWDVRDASTNPCFSPQEPWCQIQSGNWNQGSLLHSEECPKQHTVGYLTAVVANLFGLQARWMVPGPSISPIWCAVLALPGTDQAVQEQPSQNIILAPGPGWAVSMWLDQLLLGHSHAGGSGPNQVISLQLDEALAEFSCVETGPDPSPQGQPGWGWASYMGLENLAAGEWWMGRSTGWITWLYRPNLTYGQGVELP